MSDSSFRAMHGVLAVVVSGFGFGATSIADAQAQDGALGERYLALAKDRIAAYDTPDAITLLSQAASVCPTWETQQQLGELAAGSPDEAHKRVAVEAFVAAHTLATTPAADARTLYEYAALLAREGDPQNAHPLATNAWRLSPDDARIVELLARLEEEVGKPNAATIRAGLKSQLFVPLTFTNQQPGSSAEPAPRPSYGPSINIRMTFTSGSVELDAETRPNVAVLAEALADPTYAQDKFVFIGHADVRGDADMNFRLSIERAEAIKTIVTTLQPSLAGRIRADGRGEFEPLDPAADERAFRANRRLQILIEK